MTWATTNETTLFTYPTGLSWYDFQNPTFRPNFNEPASNPACRGDRECEFDVAVTGSLSIGLSNIAMKELAAEIKRQNDESASFCPTSFGVNNGEIIVTENQQDKDLSAIK